LFSQLFSLEQALLTPAKLGAETVVVVVSLYFALVVKAPIFSFFVIFLLLLVCSLSNVCLNLPLSHTTALYSLEILQPLSTFF